MSEAATLQKPVIVWKDWWRENREEFVSQNKIDVEHLRLLQPRDPA